MQTQLITIVVEQGIAVNRIVISLDSAIEIGLINLQALRPII